MEGRNLYVCKFCAYREKLESISFNLRYKARNPHLPTKVKDETRSLEFFSVKQSGNLAISVKGKG